jgi:hypothetical protein
MLSASEPILAHRIVLTKQRREDWRSLLYDVALVVAHTERGGLVCEWGGIRFRIGAGMTREVRAIPPKVGTKIRFSCRGTNWRGRPHAPAFVEQVTSSASPPSPQA